MLSLIWSASLPATLVLLARLAVAQTSTLPGTFNLTSPYQLNTSQVTLSALPSSSVFGGPVTVTAQVTPSSATGKVTFYDGTTVLGTSTLSAGTATFSTLLLPVGTRKLRAYYAGDANNGANTSNAITQTVNAVGANIFALLLNPPVLPGASEPVAVVVADFNGDGKADLALGCDDGQLRILLGKGNGTFQTPVAFPIGTSTNQISVGTGDFNGDGWPDIAVVDGPDQLVTIFLGLGNGTFQIAGHLPIGTFGSAIAVGDFNGDGRADLAVTKEGNDSNVSVFLGNGDGTFQAGVSYATQLQAVGVAVGDFNGDGKPDLAVSSFNCCNNISILLGNGDGTFQPAAYYAAGQAPWHIATGDFNGDGKLDLAVALYGADAVSVLLGNGDGTFQAQVSYPVGSYPYSVAVGDFDGDGRLDLAVPGTVSNDVSILIGKGDGTFQPAISYPAGSEPDDVAVADFNGDGRADLILPDRGADISILLGATASMRASAGTPQAPPFATPLAVTMTDQYGAPLGGVTVAFSAPSSGASATLSSATALTNAFGVASVTATDHNIAGSYTVTARAGLYLMATFSLASYPPGTTMAITGGNPQWAQTGAAFAQPLQVTVTDANHNPIAGMTVTFTQQGLGFPSAVLSSGTAITDASGVASVTATASNIPGPYAVIASLGPLSTSFSLHNLGQTTMTLTASPNPSAFGAPVTLTTQNTGCTTGGGFTSFYDGATILATKPGMLSVTRSTILLPAGTRKLLAYYSGDSVWCLPGTSNIVTQTVNAVAGAGFITGTPLSTGAHAGNLVVADFNGDGNADLAFITSGAADGITVQLGNGDGTFQLPTSVAFPLGVYVTGIAVGDFNHDGKPDLAVSNHPGNLSDSTNNYVTVLIGIGNGTFQAGVNYTVGSQPTAIAVADFNFDGLADIVTVSADNVAGSVSVLLGKPDGTFAPAGSSPTGTAADDSLVIGDFNGDGKPDLAIGSFGSSSVNILLGRGDGTFLSPLSNNTSWANFMTVADVNGDGIPDLITMDGAASAMVLIGNGDGTFQPPRLLLLNSVGPPDGLAVADFNGDGKADLAVSNFGGGVQILQGNGDGTFRQAITYMAGSGPGRLVVGDFNGDGRADLAVSNLGNTVTLLLGSAAGLDISTTHVDPFALGQNGATYSITVSNRAATIFNDAVTVTETVPTGLTLVGMAGSGWNCPANGITCTRSEALAGGASYPAITATVKVASNAPSAVLNYASVTNGALAPVTSSALTYIAAPPVLSVSTPPDAATATAGSTIGYTISVRNSSTAGTGAASATALNDALPTGTGINWTISPAYTGQGSCAITETAGSQTLACSFGILAAGAAASVHVTSGTSSTSCAIYTNTAIASAGNSDSIQASAPTTVLCPSLSVTKSHMGNFAQGQTNATYTAIVSNSAVAAPTSGTVTVTETLPAGLTLVSMAGTGWSCPGGNTCSRIDALTPGTSYPPITVTVNVAANALAQVTNQVSVSGGGSTSANASDPTTVLQAGGAPAFQTLSPPGLTGTSGLFTLQFFDGNGSTDLNRVQIVINDYLRGFRSCLAYYTANADVMYLLDDGGSRWMGPIPFGTAGVLTNSQCALDMSRSTRVRSGNTLTLNLFFTFNPGFVGGKNIFTEVMNNSAQSLGWQTVGGYTVTPGTNTPPTINSVTPNAGSGSSNLFRVQLSDPDGGGDLDRLQLIIQNGFNPTNSCYVYYAALSGLIYLASDNPAVFLGPVMIGQPATLQNSQCMLRVGTSGVLYAGNSMEVDLDIAFKTPFTGAKTVYAETRDRSNAGANNWVALGTWTAAGLVNQVPAVDAVAPATGAGRTGLFTVQYSDGNGYTDLERVQVLFNSTLNPGTGCLIQYVRGANLMYLLNDAGTGWIGPAMVGPGGGGVLQNSRCAVNAGGTVVTASGNSIQVLFPMTFWTPAFNGAKNIYGEATDSGGLSSNWHSVGTWTVQ